MYICTYTDMIYICICIYLLFEGYCMQQINNVNKKLALQFRLLYSMHDVLQLHAHILTYIHTHTHTLIRTQAPQWVYWLIRLLF